MIPLGDASRRPLRIPIVTISLIAANGLVFLLELASGNAFIIRWSMVPANIMAGRDDITILTAMFMHAGWLHILGNMLFFWVFSPEIEDVMGPLRYLTFYLLGGLVATVAQILIDPTSTIPNLGASGAIAGVMGAFLVTYPRDRIRTIYILGLVRANRFHPGDPARGHLVSDTVLQRSRCVGPGTERRGGLYGPHRWVYLRRVDGSIVRIPPATLAAGARISSTEEHHDTQTFCK